MSGNREQGSKWLHPPTRLRIYERDDWHCVWCMCPVERPRLPEDGILVRSGDIRQASVDHVIPRSRGGSNNAGNLITCCAQCNTKRRNKSVEEFARELAFDSPQIEGTAAAAIVRRVRAAQGRKLPSRVRAAA